MGKDPKFYLKIKNAVNRKLKKKKDNKNMEMNEIPASMPNMPSEQMELHPGGGEMDAERPFVTPEEYKSVTGKRFRMTADQKKRVSEGSLTRQGAFEERYNELLENYKSQNN